MTTLAESRTAHLVPHQAQPIASDTIKETFDKLDTDHDGAITCNEFVKAFTKRIHTTSTTERRGGGRP